MPGGNHRRFGPALAWPSAVRVLLLALALAALQSGAAMAHAVLIESVPADGERLDRAPSELRLQFNEPVSPVTVRLLDARMAELPEVTVEPHGDTIVLRTARPLPHGAYFLSYRVTSLDAHVVAATLRFGVGVAPPGAEPRDDAPSWSAWATVAARLLLYLTALGAIRTQPVRPGGAAARDGGRTVNSTRHAAGLGGFGGAGPSARPRGP